MKKVLCLLLCTVMVLSSVSAMAKVNEFGEYGSESVYNTTNIFVRGQVEDAVQQVTILFKNDNGDIGYIGESEPDKDGFYRIKFKFIANDGNPDGYKVTVRDSATSKDITNTLQEVSAQKEALIIDIDLNVAGDNDVIKYVSEGEYIDLVADIYNKYSDKSKASVMLAAYDENNKLLAIETKTLDIGFGDLKTKKTVSFEELAFPAEAVKAKAFIWQDAENLMPLTKAKTMEAYGEEGSRTFRNLHEDKSKPWVVGLTGASTVHAGEYAAFLYHYYATRHPEENIIIVNKGAAGCTAFDIFNRKGWDVFNENDPLNTDDVKYGTCDEIAIMVGANDLNYTSYANGKMDEEDYMGFYNGENIYTNHPVTNKNGNKVSNMSAEIEDSFNNYVKIVDWCEENGKKVVFTPMTLHDDSEDFEHILYEVGNVYGFNHALGVLSDKLENLAQERGLTFIDTWGMSDEYTDMIRANEDPNVQKYIDSKKGYVFLGKDGLHHSEEGGYAVGYIIARAQETDPIVAAVEIAENGSATTEDAEVSDVNYSSTGVSYTYLAKALPLYAKSKGYIHTEKLGIDITNTMNKEMITVKGLDAGTYSVKMNGTEVAQFTADQLSNGVNIATLDKNPGQIQSANLFNNYSTGSYKYASGAGVLENTGRRNIENIYRDLLNEQLRLRNMNTKEKFWNSELQKQVDNEKRLDHNDPAYETWTEQDWLDLCQYFIDNGTPTTSAAKFMETRPYQDELAEKLRYYIDGMRTDNKPQTIQVVIEKIK